MKPSQTGLPELAVKRPLLIGVLNLLIVIAGLAALLGVEVRELPDIDRPIVTVRASLPGGAPETLDAEVTSVLEGAIARVSGVREIESSSEENSGRIRIEFEPGVDLNAAAADVREAVSQVSRQLPDRVENVIVTKADADAQPMMTLALVSETLSEDELSRIIDTDIAPEIMSVEGVAALNEFSVRQRQMRVVIDPLKLSRFGLTIGDVADALRQAPFDVPVGSFRSDDQELIVRAEAIAATPALVEEVVIEGATRIADIAEVQLAPADANDITRLNGQPVVGLGVLRQAQANTIQISEGVAQKVEAINERFDNLTLRIQSDDAVFIRTSVEQVLTTLLATVTIVVVTIWLFLGSWKAALIPSIAIPVSLIGAVAGLWALGFSINLITLLALVLATGLIVDDAIVVLENIQRQQAAGLRRRASAAIGARQVFFAVIATTAVLVAVFTPISFLPSETGRLFREFGFVLAFSVVISSFVALSLAPAIAARFRFVEAERSPSPAERLGRVVLSVYERIIRMCLNRPVSTLVISIGAAAGAALLYPTIPQQLAPDEDRGRLEVFATGPDGVGLSYMSRQADQIEALLAPYLESGEIETIYTTIGAWDPNRVWVSAVLAPWEERTRSQQEIIAELRGPMAAIPGSRASVFGRSSLSTGRGGREGLRVALTGADYESIYLAARALSDEIELNSDLLTNADISYQPTQPQLSIRVDRRRAADLGVPLDELSLTLRTMVGGEELVDLNVNDQAIPIFLEAERSAIRSPSDLSNLFVRSQNGGLVALSSLTEIVEEGVAAELDRIKQRRAIEVDADIATGVALADAVTEIRRLAAETLPPDIDLVLLGDAATLQDTSRDLALTFAFAFIIVLLVLVAQFESITSPVIVMVTVPFALAAGVYALVLSGVSLNIYSQIGMILLIGLMAKNGILLVEFADQLRAKGRTVREAVQEAASLRARPIAMTLLSTVLGALPLVLATGAGSEARQSIGWVIFGGLGMAAGFTLFLTPVVYLLLARFARVRTEGARNLGEELAEAEAKLRERLEPAE